MPRKATSNGAKKDPEKDPEQRLIEAALALALERGWRVTTMAEIAKRAGLGLPEAYALHGSKVGILRGLARRIDREVLAGASEAREGRPRDRLFDVLMRRFDALRPHQAAL
ncbi:MAG TPA: TetR family transcriptional regulator, partial [Stellaceae bacterium]|nr:TetR family transcriptional regulator [Stellaceae bacterium]